MRKKLGLILIGLGAALIFSALLLLIYNQWENEKAGESAECMLAEVQFAIEEQLPVEGVAGSTELTEGSEEFSESESEQTKTTMLNGYSYLGILKLPSLNLELPVLNDCDITLLKLAPCRDMGDLSSDDLVIAAHNYKNHFGRISQMSYGDEIIFTDMNGTVYSYQVTEIELFHPDDFANVLAKDHQLLLYTCDYTNQNRIAVHCRKVNENA